ncbi:MAG TPA: protein translocase subunit SecD, partial [Ktedonobacterales bacterium]|nr:protein translocase subunit SecD [Ktedonobacterales bacterium]
MRRGNTLLFLLVILLLGGSAFYVDFQSIFGWPTINVAGYKNNLELRQGLDLKGGVQFVFQASCPRAHPKCDIQGVMPQVVDNINRRISQGLAVSEASVRPSGDRILVQLPGFTNAAQASALLGQTGEMNIIDTGSNYVPEGTTVTPGQYPVRFTGAELDTNQISAGLDSSSGKPIVTFAFTGKAKSDFAKYTAQHINQYLTITLDNKVINSAVIQSEIDGNGQITGLGTIDKAQNLAALLKYGALPLPLTVVSSQEIAPTIGQEALQFSIRAAIVGLGMVVLFMLIYYRLPGLLADIALLLYALLLFAVIKLLGVTLSLPGIAAVILTIGMAVDANILIFERMKEELRAGRTMASAIDLGFKRAWPSIRDSNFSTLITCLILYWFGNNFGATLIVGFAINLALGVLLSLFTAVVVTRNFLHVLQLANIAQHPALYGLPQSALNLPRYRPSEQRAQRAASLALAGAGAGGTARA